MWPQYLANVGAASFAVTMPGVDMVMLHVYLSTVWACRAMRQADVGLCYSLAVTLPEWL